jgi:tetratricopeptide (TPR) repeat protein
MSIQSITVLMNRAWLLYEQSRSSLALREITQVLGLDPEYAKAHSLRGLCLDATDKYEEGLEAIQLAIALDPNNPEYYYHLAYVYKRNLDWVAANRAINQAIKLAPENVCFRVELADIAKSLSYEDLTKLEQILPNLDLGIDLILTPGAHRRVLLESIVILVNRALELSPENFNALYLRLIAFSGLNHLTELKAGCQELLAINPNDARAHYMMGICCQQNLQWAESINFFQTALSIQPIFPAASYSLNHSHEKLAELQQVQTQFKSMFRLPCSTLTWNISQTQNL